MPGWHELRSRIGMKFALAPLPYEKHALAPYISAETLDNHYERHHRGYIEKLKQMIAGTSRARATLEQLVWETDGEVFNLAAQVWNHTFYFDGMRPAGGGRPTAQLASAIERDLGSYERLRRSLCEAANEHFGSGWAWLALDRRRRLHVVATCDADTPVRQGLIPLLGIDLWEHAYYLDYRSDRGAYMEGFLDHLVDWHTVARRFAAQQPAAVTSVAAKRVLTLHVVAASRGAGKKTAAQDASATDPDERMNAN